MHAVIIIKMFEWFTEGNIGVIFSHNSSLFILQTPTNIVVFLLDLRLQYLLSYYDIKLI